MAANPQWPVVFLRSIGAKVTPHNVAFLIGWWKKEGGDLTNNAKFNWLNTTHGKGFPSINSVGVKAYPNFQTGIKQLKEVFNYYPHLKAALQSGNVNLNDPGVQADLNYWLSGKKTPGMSTYIKGIAEATGSPVSVLQTPTTKTTSPTLSSPQNGLHGVSTPDLTLILNPTGGEASVNLKPGKFVKPLTVEAHQASIPFRVITLRGGKAEDGSPLPKTPVQIDRGVNSKDPRVKEMLDFARHYLGTPYQFGSAGPKTFDCSGFAQYIYKHMGVDLPRDTWHQINVGTKVNRKQLKPGDLVFFYGGEHEGIYIGNGQFIHAPHTGDVVKISKLSDYSKVFYAARRVI